ncbi:MAG TPA: zinc-dependent metalloprotease [Acidimicrobiales bacterium]|jgi:putative hydrolase|nr:zinc-dependent metalloprotease [Acidimicrobiales bacterium]
MFGGSMDPDNPMGGLLGDLMKVIGSGSGAGDSWFEAARTLAFGVATDGGQDETPDPLVRIAFEELARVAELHVAAATGITPTSGGTGVSFETVGPGQWSFRVLEAYRPVLKAMVEAQQQGVAAVPSTDLSALDLEEGGGLGGLIGQFALTLGPVFLGMQFGSAAGHLARRAFGQYALPLPWPESSTLLLVPGNVARFADDWSLPLQEVQLWVCLRELTMHAVLTRPGVRSSLTTLLGDASAHAAAAQRNIVERLGDSLNVGDQASLENALGDPEALLADLISPEQRNISGALTAQTTALGAYVDHVTATIAETLTSSPGALREAWYRYRIEEGKGEQAFAGLFGLDVGQEEVDRGRAFVQGVIERAGGDALTRLLGDELDLPTPAEVDAPGLWLARIGLME